MEQLLISHFVIVLALALTFGGMTFLTAVVAPLVFVKLPWETARAFIRQLLPWYYLTMAVKTLIALLVLIPGAGGSANWELLLTALVLVVV